MFEFITNKIDSIFGKILSKDRLTPKNIQEGVKEIRKALLDADVNYKVVQILIDKISERALGEAKVTGVTASQQFIKIFYDELVRILGVEETKIEFSRVPLIIFLVGLQGSGKTTTSVKLANLLKKDNKKVLVVGADTFRPAAKEQIKQLAEKSGIEYYTSESDDLGIIKEGIKLAKNTNTDAVIVDTQGRLHIQKELMEHLKKLYDEVKPDYVFYVVDSMVGQDAVNQASIFLNYVKIRGYILTKLDGDAKGGVALSLKTITGLPIYFVGVGERIEDLQKFYPERMAERILGMGDIVSLVEKAREHIQEEEAKKMQEKLISAEFTFDDFLKQIKLMKKLGGITNLLSYLPIGLKQNLPDNVDVGKEVKRMEAIILSMTPQERQTPQIINESRRRRIAKGSGTSTGEVKKVIDGFLKIKNIMRKGGKSGIPSIEEFQKMFGI